jgi:hypothetical protein
MNRKTQLKIIVFLCMIIVVFVYFYINKSFTFGINKDFQDLRDSVEIKMDGATNLNLLADIREKFSDIKEQMEGNQEDLKSQITEKVLDKLSDQNNIIYEYEPWGIKFSYDSLMIKEIDQSQEKILFFYEDFQDTDLVIERHGLEGTFNDWLNDNYNLQDLDKYEYNDLIFWMQDLSSGEEQTVKYYVNRGKDIFIISLNLLNENKETHWDSLQSIVKSFSLIKDN